MPANHQDIAIADVRRRLLQAIDQSRRAAAARQERADRAAIEYERFLSEVATPIVQRLASALRAERLPFTVYTPAAGLRLASGRSGEDYIEFALATSGDQPLVSLRVSRTWGSRVLGHERTLREDAAIEDLTQEDVLQALLDEIGPFVER